LTLCTKCTKIKEYSSEKFNKINNKKLNCLVKSYKKFSFFKCNGGFKVAGFSDAEKLKDDLIEVIESGLGVNGNLCIEILTGRQKKSPASKTDSATLIRVDHERVGSGDDPYVRIQVQKGKDTYASCIVYNGVLPPYPSEISTLKNFINMKKNEKQIKNVKNPSMENSELWEKVIKVAKLCKVTVRDTKKLPDKKMDGADEKFYNLFLERTEKAALAKFQKLNAEYEKNLIKTAINLRRAIINELVGQLNVDVKKRTTSSIKSLG